MRLTFSQHLYILYYTSTSRTELIEMKFNFEKVQWKFRYLIFGLTAIIGAMTLQNYEALTIEFLICMFLTVLSYSNMIVFGSEE